MQASAMRRTILLTSLAVMLTVGSTAHAQLDLGGFAKKAAGEVGNSARDKVVKEVNAKLLAEGRKNQCSFKTDSDELMPGCDQKLKKLASTLIEAKKRLSVAGVTNFKFEVSGHTDSVGKADYNKKLSEKRASTIAKEMTTRGIAQNEIMAVGLGSERPVVKPDNTEAKRAKNRRYEIQIRF